MPTVVSVEGFDIIVRTLDHAPPHVHVKRAGGEVRVTIGDAAALWDERLPMKSRDIRRAVELVAEHLEACNAAWRAIHG